MNELDHQELGLIQDALMEYMITPYVMRAVSKKERMAKITLISDVYEKIEAIKEANQPINPF